MDDLIINSLLNTVSAVVIGSTIIICAAWVITSIVASTRQRANTRTRAEVYNRLIDKFGTAAELIEFFESDAGFRFIEEHTLEVSQPVAKIMGSIRLGVTLGLIGIGALVVGNVWAVEIGQEPYVAIALGGTIALTAGVGFIAAAAISYWLCKMWGLLPGVENKKSSVQ